MRALFLFLLLANVAFFAWARYVSPANASADPAPLAREIAPEKLRILPPGEAPATAVQRTPGAISSAAGCMEWGSFTLVDAPRAEQQLQSLALGGRLGQRLTEEKAAWWVLIPPQANRQAALKKAAELKSLGVTDYFVVQEDGEHRWALSLGVFRNEDAAQARLSALRQSGVRSAEIRPRETVVPKVWLQVREVDPVLESKLKDIANRIEGSELRTCP
jgi:SPOR domain